MLVWLFARPSADLADVRALVRRSGGTVRRTSRWLHAVSARLPPPALAAARAAGALRHLQPVAVFRRAPRPATPAFAGAPAGPDSVFGPSAAVLRTLNAFPLIERGFRGAGVTIALLDTGFETGLPAFAAATVAAQHDFVFDDAIVRNEPADDPDASEHGTMVWSLLAADVPDSLVGLAPDAAFLLAKTEDIRSETAVEEDNYVAALEWADSLGADVVASSLTYRTFDGGGGYTFADLNGDIAVTTVAADLAVARGMVVVTAIGNTAGSRTLGTPADGDSVLAIGAVDTLGATAAFSSRGPTADGRIKPDLLAPGVNVRVLAPAGFTRASGTSFATPLVAGLAALLREIHPVLGPQEIAGALRRSADNAAQPDTLRGWGVPDAFQAGVFPFGLVVAPAPPDVPEASPRIQWAADGIPAFALPVTFRVVAGADPGLASPRIDTTVLATAITLPLVLQPQESLYVRVTATAADSAALAAVPSGPRVGPPWVVLEDLNAPGGVTIRDLRPAFDWSAPFVAPAVGAFRFRVEVLREADGGLEIAQDSLTASDWVPPRDLERNTPYRWRVTAFIGGDSSTVESAGPFVIVDDTAPAVTTLFQNFPNPFPNAAIGQSRTCIWFDLASEGAVRLEILDVRGHALQRLLPGGNFGIFLRPGRYGRPSTVDGGRCDPQLEWDGTAFDGSVVPPGVYVARLSTPDGAFFRRIVFLGRP